MIKCQPLIDWFALQTKVFFYQVQEHLCIMLCVESQPRSERSVHMLLDQVEVAVGFLLQSLAILLGGHSLLTGF